jgi:hypothetical protein
MRVLAAACLIVAMPADFAVAQTPSGMIPGGSYTNSCKDITFDAATNRLNATCDFNDPGGLWMKGEPVRSSEGFDVTGCVPNSIFNDNGMLYCFTEAAWGNGRRIPKGSYLATCTRSRVTNNVLIAECDDSRDETVYTELNLNECQWGGDISNQSGRLRCELAAAPAEPAPRLIKPVEVAPLIKPVTIAPVAPADDGATTADPKSRKKRDRRTRGERG